MYAALVLLVVLAWEFGKGLARNLGRCLGHYRSTCQRRKETSLLQVEKSTTNGPDRWEVYRVAKFAVLIHHKPRQVLFDPSQARLPFRAELLSGIRITVVYYLSSREYRFIVDCYSEPGRARYNLHQAWVGQTVLLLT